MDLDVTETGAGDALVVFVHGVLDSGRSFSRVVDLLGGECRMLCFDRRGYGSSADAPGAPADLDVHIEDLLAVLAGRRAVLVGHSFGGVIAAGAAVRAPDQVEALVLYESVFAWSPGWDDTPMRTVLTSDDPDEAGLRLMLRERYDAVPADVRARLRRQASAFVAEERSTRVGPPPYDLADLRAPVVYGVSDTTPLGAIADHLRDRTAQVEVVTVPGGGHNAHRAAPEAFADLVRLGLRRRLAVPG